ncbi:hypothetical protein D3C76_743040 [compost metagenome]
MRHSHHGLTGTDDLTGLDQRLHDNAIGIGQQLGVACRITGDFRLGLGRAELGPRRIRRSLVLVVGRCRYRAGAAQCAIAGFIVDSLLRPRSHRGDRFALRMGGELQVDGV